MIEILRAKIETLSPNQRQLIKVDEDDMLFYILSDIDATVGRNYLLNYNIIFSQKYNFIYFLSQITSVPLKSQ